MGGESVLWILLMDLYNYFIMNEHGDSHVMRKRSVMN